MSHTRPPTTPTRTQHRRATRADAGARGSPGPCSRSPWPPRSWSSSTSPSSTPPCHHRPLPAPRAASDLQWLVTAYLMMSGGGLLLGGRIADLLSRRRVFLTGLALFTVASLVSGFADSGGQLIAARAVQGLSAALLTPSALSLIMTTYAGAAAQGRPRPVGRGRQPRRRRRRPRRRRHHDLGQLAVHLLGQRPRRRSSPCSSGAASSPRTAVARPRLRDFDLPGAADRHRRPRAPWSTPSAAPRPTAGGRPAP